MSCLLYAQRCISILLPPTLATHDDIKIRQLIWAEYRAGRSRKRARINISAKLRFKCFLRWKINRWYNRFELDKTSLFNEGTKQYNIVHAIQTLSNGAEVRTYTI